MKATPSGTIQVNAAVTFGAYALAPFITRYLDRYPDTQIELTLNDRRVDPIEEGFEVIVRIGELADSSMIAWPLRPYRLIACGAAANGHGSLFCRGVEGCFWRRCGAVKYKAPQRGAL